LAQHPRQYRWSRYRGAADALLMVQALHCALLELRRQRMARPARLVIPGLPHRVIQRGKRRKSVFFGKDDQVGPERLDASRAP
jgi:hypothetical protein